MKLNEFKIHFQKKLKGLYPDTEIASFFNLLIEFKLGMTRIDIALQPNFELNSNNLDFFNNALIRLQKEEPIQYIIGKTEFYGIEFSVNENVLIPRPETEELIQWILDDVRKKESESLRAIPKKIKILDIGTGSGCIAISLAKSLHYCAEVWALDISENAIEVAKKNAKHNNCKVNFIQENALNLKSLPETFDIIVSNPPYVRELEKEQMKKNVLDNEPHLALFVSNENPLVFYDKIADLAKNHLKKNGSLYYEINQYLGDETSNLLYNKGFKKVYLKKDIFDVDRMIKAKINQ